MSARLRSTGLLVFPLLTAACGVPPDSSEDLASEPFGHLAQCDSSPYVAVVRGATPEGDAHELPGGSTPSDDIYGLRPDGSTERLTKDLGTYQFSLSEDATTVLASPYPVFEDPSVTVEQDPTPTTFDSLVLISTESGESTPVLEHPRIDDVALAPDGRHVAVTATFDSYTNSQLAFLDLDEVDARLVPQEFEKDWVIDALAWSPDGSSLAYLAMSTDGSVDEVRVVDPFAGVRRVVFRQTTEVGALRTLDWSPDGERLLSLSSVYDSEADALFISGIEIDVAKGSAATVLRPDVSGLTNLLYSAADGSMLTGLQTVPGTSSNALTWRRGADGAFQRASAAPVGEGAGISAVDQLDIPACALSEGA